MMHGQKKHQIALHIVPQKIGLLCYCESSFSLYSWRSPLFCVTADRVTTVSTSPLNLWQPKFCFIPDTMTIAHSATNCSNIFTNHLGSLAKNYKPCEVIFWLTLVINQPILAQLVLSYRRSYRSHNARSVFCLVSRSRTTVSPLSFFCKIYIHLMEPGVAQWLRHYATSRADRIPVASVTGIFLVDTDRTMCPGVNSASKKWVPGFPLGVKAAGAWGWRPTTLVVPNVKKSRALTYQDPLGPSRRPLTLPISI